MTPCQNLLSILVELSEDAKQIDQVFVEGAVKCILKAKRVFVAGAGRSGFAARAFSNRLMHLGLDVHFVGEPTCPSIRKGDVLVMGSGSGETESMVTKAQKAKWEGAKVITLTLNASGPIAKLADIVVLIPGRSSRASSTNVHKAASIQPAGSSFEQLSWLIYDAMVVDLKRELDQSQQQMDYRHANME